MSSLQNINENRNIKRGPKSIHRETIMDVSFLSCSFSDALIELVMGIEEGKQMRVMTANPEFLMFGRKHPEFQEVLESADYVVPDGIGILIGGKIIGKSIMERIAGYDLTLSLLKEANQRSWRVYFLGGSPEVMDLVYNKVVHEYPQIDLKCHHGFFTENEESAILQEIKNHKPHLLFVGLGVPKQEYWLQEHLPQLPIQLGMGVGGTFDGLAGKIKRAPLFWQRIGLEWLYRLIQEPWRWKRMLVLPQFLGLMFIEKFRSSKG